MFESWSEFNVAMAGATAALAGLVIVAASVNIAEIVKSRTLTARLLAGIAALLLALAVSALGLIPGIDGPWFGVAAVAATLLLAETGLARQPVTVSCTSGVPPASTQASERSRMPRSTSRSTCSRSLMYRQPTPVVCGPSFARASVCSATPSNR